ncbi:2-phospho-L-lactate guanylyltransferase [Agromyces silvae]|uniref:2-phospho-L-lactate guanylyltransferase n=1 Tax=Agromyces silvae TaxID=3388266 RepID=UPI00280B95A1|nr:2-phospho-L-lactate guanylyltransferase [Agromyces protaetiae]
MRAEHTRHPRPFGEAASGGVAASWTVVIPAKAPARAKSRLAPHVDDASRAALARAFAADTIAAALTASSVARVIVVGDDPSLAGDAEFLDERGRDRDRDPGRSPESPTREDGNRGSPAGEDGNRGPGSRILDESRPHETGGTGLTAAIAFGVAHARGTGAGGVAVLLGDLPCLRSDDLDDALALAAEHPLAFVSDADGTGTTLATARAGVRFEPHFGPDSAAGHRRAGFVPLEASARLRRDVDTLAALEDAIALGTGPHTAHVVATLADRRPAPPAG